MMWVGSVRVLHVMPGVGGGGEGVPGLGFTQVGGLVKFN